MYFKERYFFIFYTYICIYIERERCDVLLNKPMVYFQGGETFEKLKRHPKRMLQKQMKLQYIQKIEYSSVHFSFLRSIAHWFISYSATAFINLPSHSLNHIVHRLTYTVSQTLSQYTNQSVISDFGQLHLKFARSVYPKSANQKYNSPFIHQVTLSLVQSVTYSFGAHSPDV